MKRLPPDKRNKLIMVILGTLALIGLVYFILIAPQNEQNRRLAVETKTDESRRDMMGKTILQAETTAKKADAIADQLMNSEKDLVEGDVIVWTYETLRQFKANRHVDITTLGQPIQSDEDLLPSFPYKQIQFHVAGTGYYHDIGKFIADLENQFPHIRVLNLVVEPNTGPEAAPEKLSFRMDIAALLKPNN